MNLLEELTQRREELVIQLEAIDKLIEAETRTTVVLSNEVNAELKDKEVSRFTPVVFRKQEIDTISRDEVQELLNNYICSIKYQKKDGSIRNFKVVSSSQEALESFFDKNPSSDKKAKSKLNMVYFVEAVCGELHFKNIFKHSILEIKVIEGA